MSNKALTLSIIIPVYNEEGYIAACLDSIAAQTLKPLEVIVVDNNSTDKSVAIAKQYSFVKVLHEKHQHQVFAQAAGFNVAKGDILGRIDADSILPSDWTQKIIDSFANDDELVATTGGADPYDVPLKWIGSSIFHWYFWQAGVIAGHRLLWGSNCAVRAITWGKVRNMVMMRADIWEDYDMAFCLAKYGKVKYITNNLVGVSFRAMHTTFSSHVAYQWRSIRTFYHRTNSLRTSLFFLQWTLVLVVYPVAALDDYLLKRREKKLKVQAGLFASHR
jgi:glycosyltransferase involved in cell wall biosynthesis